MTCTCAGEWRGGGHCRDCCQTFRSDTAFDAHRTGPFTARTCIDVMTTPGWRQTRNGWTNGPEMPRAVLASMARTGEQASPVLADPRAE